MVVYLSVLGVVCCGVDLYKLDERDVMAEIT